MGIKHASGIQKTMSQRLNSVTRPTTCMLHVLLKVQLIFIIF